MSESKEGKLYKKICTLIDEEYYRLGHNFTSNEEFAKMILDEAKADFPWLGRNQYIEEGWTHRDDEEDCNLIIEWFKKQFGSE